MAEKKGPVVKKGKTNKVYENYKVEGDKLNRLKKQCPKCGSSVCMADHKDRNTCGMCHYTEFKSNK